jgi:hypothetical protein
VISAAQGGLGWLRYGLKPLIQPPITLGQGARPAHVLSGAVVDAIGIERLLPVWREGVYLFKLPSASTDLACKRF